MQMILGYKWILIFLLLNLDFGVMAYGQDDYISSGYYLTIYKADSLYIENKYDLSFKLLLNLFNVKEPINISEYREFETYVKSASIIGQDTIAFNGFKKLIKVFGYNWQKISKDKILSKIADDNNFDFDDFQFLNKLYLKKVVPELTYIIKEIRDRDQEFRNVSADYFKKNIYKQTKNDSINKIALKEVFEKYGFPNLKKVGNEEIKDITVALLHTTDNDRVNYFLPKILEFIKIGECEPILYGYMYDQLQLYNNKPQKYGTYNSRKTIESSFVLSKDSINHFRKSIGLPTYNYERWRLRKKYSIDFINTNN